MLAELLLSATSRAGVLRVLAVTVPVWLWPWGALALAAVLAVLLGLYLWVRRVRQRREARYEAVFEHAPGALLLVRTDLCVERVNAAAEALLGRPAARLRGRRLETMMETEGGTLDPAALPGSPEAEATTLDVTVPREDDDPVEALLRVRRVLLEGEAFYLAALEDVTPERNRYRQLQAFHRTTLDNLPVETSILTPKGAYLYANPKLAPGPAAQDWLSGKTDFDFCEKLGLHPEIALRRRAHRQRALSAGERVFFEESVPLPDGGVRHYNRYYTPIFDFGGEAYAVVCSAVDTTELQGQRAEIEAARGEAEKFAKLKASFLDNIGHEFRTPVSSIIGSAQILVEEADEGLREFAVMIERNGRRLMNTLGAMLDLGRLEAGGIQLRPRVVNLMREVEDVVGSLQPMAEEKGIFLRVKATQQDAMAWLDQSALYRVLSSLIGNAVKFTGEGGVVIEVMAEGGAVRVRVIDSGVGIQEDYLQHLFAAFNQESAGLERSFEGMGVGLAITKRLLDSMGGELEVASAKGEGSVFEISFPEAFRAIRGEHAGDGALGRSRVLVGENTAEGRKLLGHLLSPHVEADLVDDFPRLLDRAERRAYDAVLLDPSLSEGPPSDEMVARLRALDGCEALPIIAVDGLVLPGGREQFLSAGYDDCVARPVEKEPLLNALGKALARTYAGRQERAPAALAERS